MTFTLPAKPAIVTAIAAGTVATMSARIADFAARKTYVLGPGGISILRDGRVVIDANRDPSADWASFDPTVPLAAELRVAGQTEIEALGFTVAQARTVYSQLKAGNATAPNAQKFVSALARYLWRDLVNDL